MPARRATHREADGGEYTVWMPADAPPAMTAFGTRLGPPPLDELGLPDDTRVRLQNQLNARGILTYDDLRRRRSEAINAIQAAFRVDVNALEVLYKAWNE